MKFLIINFFFIVNTILYADELIIISSKNIKNISKDDIDKLFKGKVYKLDDINIKAVNRNDKELKSEFVEKNLNMNLKTYEKYWLVRQYIGKGSKLKEIDSIDELVEFIAKNDNVISYVYKSELSNKNFSNIRILNE